MPYLLDSQTVIQIILEHYPEAQAIYVFGSVIADNLRPDSDIDLALLLPHEIAKKQDNLSMISIKYALEHYLQREVDLINIRQVATVFQYVIINQAKIIYCADEFMRNTFEMLVWSFYQKLNEERAAILEEFFKTGKAYAV